MSAKPIIVSLGLIFTLTACYHPPFNNFRTDHSTARTAAIGTSLGTAAGLISGYTVPGVGIGLAAGTAVGVYKDSKRGLLSQLRNNSIEYVEHGSTKMLIIPTDKYYLFNEAELNDLYFEGLNAAVKLLKYYPKSQIYVAAFSDNIGSEKSKVTLTQARAETMLTFLWGNGFKSAQLQAEGYGDKFAIGDNHLIHGSAYNRRVEIQWIPCIQPGESPAQLMYNMK